MDKSSEAYKLAKKRVEEKKGLLIHLGVYVIINAGLAALDALTAGGWWFYWVMLGWGIGMAIHIVVYFVENSSFVREWEEKELKRQLDS